MTQPEPQQATIPAGYELRRKKHRKWPWILLVIVAIIIIASVASNGGSAGGITGTSTVVYSVTSDASQVSVTYATLNNGNIGEQQDTAAKPPWTATVKAGASFVHSFTLTAQQSPASLTGGKDGTSISCKITVNGKVVSQQTSHGQYATVLCSAT